MLHGHPHRGWLSTDAVFVRWPSDSTPSPLESAQGGDWSQRHTSMMTDLHILVPVCMRQISSSGKKDVLFGYPRPSGPSHLLSHWLHRRNIYVKMQTFRSIKVECWTLKEHKWHHSMIEVSCIMDYRLRHFCILEFTAWLYSLWWRRHSAVTWVQGNWGKQILCVFELQSNISRPIMRMQSFQFTSNQRTWWDQKGI